MKRSVARREFHSPQQRWKGWRLAQHFFLIAGVLLIGFTAYTYAARNIWQAYEHRLFDHAAAPGESPAPTVALHGLIGKIAIPRLNIAAMINEGVDERTLDLAVGHIPSTALPGQQGNVGLAAHRDTLFRNLKNVRRDDEIALTTLNNRCVYRVVSVRVVNPGEVSVLDASADEKILTLVTCYPFYFVGHAPRRFIVRARQVSGISPHRARS